MQEEERVVRAWGLVCEEKYYSSQWVMREILPENQYLSHLYTLCDIHVYRTYVCMYLTLYDTLRSILRGTYVPPTKIFISKQSSRKID